MDADMRNSEKNKKEIGTEELNPYQREAVEDMSKATLVNACVGSGKTTVLTMKARFLHEAKGIPYESMMILTFTNRAADEIRERLQLPAAGGENRRFSFGTFHSVARQLLDESPLLDKLGWQRGFTMILPEEEEELARQLIREKKLKVKYPNRLPKRLEQERAAWQSGGKSRYKDDLFLLFPLLEEAKRRGNRMSFSNLLEEAMKLLHLQKKEGTLVYPAWLIVDEVQDCNRQQVEMLELLYGPDTCFFAVGDPNQMIYSFRGGDETLFYYIRNHFQCRERFLPVNYRSAPEILAVANRFRMFGEQITGEQAAEADSTGQIPVHHYYDAFLEAKVLTERIRELHEKGMNYGQIAILYRMQEQSQLLEAAFERAGIPYEVRKNSSLPESVEVADHEAPGETACVHLMTLHASKGLEFDVVFLIGLNQGLLPLSGGDAIRKEEEQRLFFVGLTRARKKLELSWYTNPTQHQAVGEMSPFLRMIPEKYLLMDQERNEEEKRENLQRLRREVEEEKRRSREGKGAEATWEASVEEVQEPEEPAEIRARHAKYGEGIVASEDADTIEVEFPGYGRKSFLKLFGEVEIL